MPRVPAKEGDMDWVAEILRETVEDYIGKPGTTVIGIDVARLFGNRLISEEDVKIAEGKRKYAERGT